MFGASILTVVNFTAIVGVPASFALKYCSKENAGHQQSVNGNRSSCWCSAKATNHYHFIRSRRNTNNSKVTTERTSSPTLLLKGEGSVSNSK